MKLGIGVRQIEIVQNEGSVQRGSVDFEDQQ